MAIGKLQHIHASSIIKEIPTEGHSPLLVTGSDFNTYVAKNDKGQSPSLHLLNEVIAKYFLNIWRLPVPECAIITVDQKLLLNRELSKNHRNLNYQNPCFGSQWVHNSIDVNDFLASIDQQTYNRILNPIEFLRLCLFDEWIENDDRKPSNYNLVLEPHRGKYRITAIDHAFIFETLSHTDLHPERYTAKANDHLMISNLGNLIKQKTLIDQSLIQREKEYFYICITNCKQHFSSIIDEVNRFYPLNDESRACIERFLFHEERNHNVFQEHIYRLTHA